MISGTTTLNLDFEVSTPVFVSYENAKCIYTTTLFTSVTLTSRIDGGNGNICQQSDLSHLITHKTQCIAIKLVCNVLDSKLAISLKCFKDT